MVNGDRTRDGSLRLSRWQRMALGAAGTLLLLTAMTGPYLALEQAHQANQQLTVLRREEATVQRDEAGVQSILNFIASIQTGPQAQANRDATAWYIEQFQHICAGLPACKAVPLPSDVQKNLFRAQGQEQKEPPTTTSTPGG